MFKSQQKSLIAHGADYFGSIDVPITAKRVNTLEKGSASHPHDLTEIEHTHDFCELVIVLKGQGRHSLEGDDFPITAGDIFLLQGHQKHYFHHREELVLINIMYDPNRLQLPDSALRKLPGYCALFLLEPHFRGQHRFASRLFLDPVRLAHVEALASEIEREADGKSPGHEIALTSRLLDVMLYLSRAYSDGVNTEASALLLIGDVIGALEADFGRKWTLEDMTAIAHMSRSNFMRIFKKATGQAPIEYLTQLRIRKAMEDLRSTHQSITEIGMNAGFTDSNYFTRVFKKQTGIAPAAYRKRRVS